MLTLTEMKRLLEESGLRPNKALGQNFLCDHNLISRLIDASGARPGDLALEVGPGLGVLTEALVDRGCEIIACEIDRGLADLLDRRFRDRPSRAQAHSPIRLIRGDCLASKTALNPEIDIALAGRPFRLIANLPYGAASPLMAILASQRHPAFAHRRGLSPCLGQFVTIQREVAQRLRAVPGRRDYGELAVIVQCACEVSRIATLPPECFWPRPKVTSEMVAIVPRSEPLTTDPDRLAALCRRLFTQRRKQIGTILAPLVDRTTLPTWLDPMRRPEDISITELDSLAAWLAARTNEHPEATV